MRLSANHVRPREERGLLPCRATSSRPSVILRDHPTSCNQYQASDHITVLIPAVSFFNTFTQNLSFPFMHRYPPCYGRQNDFVRLSGTTPLWFISYSSCSQVYRVFDRLTAPLLTWVIAATPAEDLLHFIVIIFLFLLSLEKRRVLTIWSLPLHIISAQS